MGILPDLRYSASLSSAELFRAIVQDGAMVPVGMASFAAVLDAEETEAIRAYVIERANALAAASP